MGWRSAGRPSASPRASFLLTTALLCRRSPKSLTASELLFVARARHCLSNRPFCPAQAPKLEEIHFEIYTPVCAGPTLKERIRIRLRHFRFGPLEIEKILN